MILGLCLVLAAIPAGAAEKGAGTQSDGALTFFVKTIATDCSEILTEEEVRAVTGKLEGKAVGLDELQSAVDEINELYAEKGFVTARAILPPQTIEDGVVHIQLVEGRVGEIVVTGNEHTNDSYIYRRIQTRPGDLLRIDVLEREMTYFNLTNDVQLRAELRPGQAFGTTDVVLIAEESQRTQAVAYADNSGRNETGVYRAGFSIVQRSLSGFRDSLTASATVAPGSLGMSAMYDIPVGVRGAKLGVSLDISETRVISGQLQTIGVEGFSWGLGVQVRWPVAIEPTFSSQGSIALRSWASDHYFSGSSLMSSSLQTAKLSVTTQMAGERETWQIEHTLIAVNETVPKQRVFLKCVGSIVWQRVVAQKGVLTCRGMFQVADEHLLPASEQFSIGGASSVRGYSEGELTGDKGYSLSAEFSYPLTQHVRGVVFLDHAGAYLHVGAGQPAANDVFLTSAGVGAVVRFSDRLSGNLVVGVPISAQGGTAKLHVVIQTTL